MRLKMSMFSQNHRFEMFKLQTAYFSNITREIAILPQKHRFGTLTWKTAHLVNTNTAHLIRQMELELPNTVLLTTRC